MVPKPIRLLIIAALVALPITYTAFKFDPAESFTSLILFGSSFDERALDEVREIPRAYAGPDGYDGQFYAQVAIDPTLQHPQLPNALDNPRYRARRIFVPLLSSLLGLHQPFPTLQAYALINLLFYTFLLAGLVRFLHPITGRDFLCLAAIMWTTGCLISVRRSLLDLPAATFLFFAACTPLTRQIPLLGAAMLTRESSLLGFATLLSPDRRNARSVMKVAGVAVLALVPYLVWTLYVNHVFPASVSGARLSVGIPLTGMGEHLWSTMRAFPTGSKVSLLFELAAPLSLCVQAVYLITRPRPGAATWRMGIGFAVLLFFLSGPVFAEQIAYCRTVLPLTIAFNVLLMGEEQRHFTTWFIAGNVGLAWAALHMMGEMLGAF